MKEECEEAKEAAKEAMKEANPEEAREQAQKAEQCLEDAKEICEDEGVDTDEVPEIAEMEDMVEEAEDFAETAEELLEEIQEMFQEALENGEVEEDQFEEFLQGVLDGIFDNPTEAEKAKQEVMLELQRQSIGRDAVKCVNWKTGEIRYFAPDEKLNRDWLRIENFFSGIYRGADEIVVPKTIGGAVSLAKKLSVKVVNQTDTTADFTNTTPQFNDLLRNMRMFQVKIQGKDTAIEY